MVNLFLNLQVASFKSLELVYIMTQLFQLKNRILSIDILDPETGVYKPLNTTENLLSSNKRFLGLLVVMASQCLVVLVKEGPSLDTVFADYLTHADLTKYAVINPNSRTISISSADFATLNQERECRRYNG